jgi:hypothetical protein
MKKEEMQQVLKIIEENTKDDENAGIWIILHPEFSHDSQGEVVFPNSQEFCLSVCQYEYLEDGVLIIETRTTEEDGKVESLKFHHYFPYHVILAITDEY